MDQLLFRQHNGLNICLKILDQISSIEISSNSTKSANNLINLLLNATKNNYDSCVDLILSNKILNLLEILSEHSTIMLYELTNVSDSLFSFNMNNTSLKPNNNNKILNEWLICSSLFELLSSVFNLISDEIQSTPNLSSSNSSTVSTEDTNGSYKIDQNVLIQRSIDLIG